MCESLIQIWLLSLCMKENRTKEERETSFETQKNHSHPCTSSRNSNNQAHYHALFDKPSYSMVTHLIPKGRETRLHANA